MKRFHVVVMLSVLMVACSSSPPRSPPPVIEGGSDASVSGGYSGPAASQPKPAPDTDEQYPEQYPEQQPSAPAASGGAVVALMDKADYFKQSGDTDAEAATVERALRINPADASLWSRLAAIRLEQGQPQQAEQLALKSNSLAAGNRKLQAKNWLMVARARWALDDAQGARAAEQRAVESRGH